MFFRALRGTEHLYAYANSDTINNKTGFIGHLRCDFGKSGTEFWFTFFQFMREKPSKFREVFNYVVKSLRGGEKVFEKSNQILKNRKTMEKFYYKRSNENYLIPLQTEKYGARIDCEGFTFIINFYPQAGDYNAYIYCYITEHLDEHLKKSSKGIRFTDSKYDDLFSIEDGDSIIIFEPGGKFHSEKCRYLDDYHFETFQGAVFHIHEFAEYIEKNGKTIKPQGEVI